MNSREDREMEEEGEEFPLPQAGSGHPLVKVTSP